MPPERCWCVVKVKISLGKQIPENPGYPVLVPSPGYLGKLGFSVVSWKIGKLEN
jgi:hypothetical protein